MLTEKIINKISGLKIQGTNLFVKKTCFPNKTLIIEHCTQKFRRESDSTFYKNSQVQGSLKYLHNKSQIKRYKAM